MSACERLAGVEGVLLDVDGVVVTSGEPIPGAPEAVARLRGLRPVRFVTNTASRSAAAIVELLRRAGVQLDDELVTAGVATADLLRREHSGAWCSTTDPTTTWSGSRCWAHRIRAPSRPRWWWSAPALFLTACASLGLDPRRVAMVGDDAHSDVQAAQALGMVGVLGRTGKFRPSVLEGLDPAPDLVLDSVADLPGLLPSAPA